MSALAVVLMVLGGFTAIFFALVRWDRPVTPEADPTPPSGTVRVVPRRPYDRERET